MDSAHTKHDASPSLFLSNQIPLDIFQDIEKSTNVHYSDDGFDITTPSSPWNHSLPKVKFLLSLSDFLDYLPANYFQQLGESVRLICQTLLNKSPKFFIEDFCRVSANSQINSKTSSVWLSIGIDDDKPTFFIELNSSLASHLIFQLLDREPQSQLLSRYLTPSELYVLEFFVLNILQNFNNQLDMPRLVLCGISQKHPLNSSNFLTSKLLVDFENFPAPANVYFDLDKGFGNLKKRSQPLKKKKMTHFQNLISEIPSRILVDEIEIDLGELNQLAKGDVILINQKSLALIDGSAAGKVQIFLGETDSVSLMGRLNSPRNFKSAKNNLLKTIQISQWLEITIESFKTNSTFSEKTMLSTTQTQAIENLTDSQTSDNPSAERVQIENISVKLRIELKSHLLTLAELECIKSGQTIKLGCCATDPVNLVIGNKLIARGELVEIEGNLGVRIIQILN